MRKKRDISVGFMRYFSIIEELKPKVLQNGLEYIHLGKGDFDERFFKMPLLFRQVLHSSIENSYFPYAHPAGKEDTRNLLAIVESLSLVDGDEYNFREVTVAVGATQALHVVLTTLLADTKGKIILFEPTYISHIEVIKNLGAQPVLINLNGEKGFEITDQVISKIENALKKDKSIKALLAVNPSFPFGIYISQEVLDKLLYIAEKYKIHLILDESYISLNLIDKPYKKRTLLRKSKYLIKIRTFSKSLALAGIRIGYILANEKLSLKFATQNELMIGSPPTWIEPLVDLYNLAIINHKNKSNPYDLLNRINYSTKKVNILSDYLDKLTDLYESARLYKYKLLYLKQIVVNILKGNKYIGYIEPQAGINMGIYIKKKIRDIDLMKDIFLNTGVVLTPGSVFSIKEKHAWFRLTFAVEPNTLSRGLKQLVSYVNNF